jgi:hypothetical protein
MGGPSILALVRLMTRSNLVGYQPGTSILSMENRAVPSASLLPLRTRCDHLVVLPSCHSRERINSKPSLQRPICPADVFWQHVR